MDNPNVFAVLTPRDGKNRAMTAFRLPENANRFHSATGGVAEEPTINSREPTPSVLSLSEEESEVDQDATDRIILTFDKPPKDPLEGWQFGTNKLSDVLLGHRGTRGISGRQYNINVDERGWIFLHDYHSSHGTAVSYDNQKQDEVRKKETWILSRGPGTESEWEDVTIHAGGLAIKIEFPNQRAGRSEYRKNLQAFFKQSQTALPPVEALEFDSHQSTAMPSQYQTPTHRPIYLDNKVIGKGQFGEVRKVIRMRDGLYYAAKTFTPPFKASASDQKRKRDEEKWRDIIQNEIDIMRNNAHPNVMRVIDFHLTPEPTLVMPFYPDGHLERHLLTDEQYVSALRQILLGLRHLHGRGIIHRDLKPENLLIDKDKDKITVIIADFGLSKIATPTNNLLNTFCGTLLYAAPDVFPGRTRMSNGYGAKVDIWSVGIIIFNMYGLPEVPPLPKKKDPRRQAVAMEKWISTWTELLLKRLNYEDENNDKLIKLLFHMLDPYPEKRYSANQCLETGCRNGLFKKTRDGRIVDADADDTADDTAQADPTLANDVVETPTPQSPQLSETGTNETTFIAGSLWGCLERGCHNGLFRKTYDGHIVGANDTEVNTLKDAASQAEEAEEADDGTKTPTLRSPQWTEVGMNDTSFLVRNLWESVDGDRAGSMNSLSTIKGPISGAPARRPTTSTSTGLSWSFTIGLSNSDSDGGFDLDSGSRHKGGPVAGLFIRRDRFTGSLGSRRSSEDAAEEQVEDAGPRQQNLTVTDQPGLGSAAGLDSFEQRLIKLLAG